jgi:hypothetical protein
MNNMDLLEEICKLIKNENLQTEQEVRYINEINYRLIIPEYKNDSICYEYRKTCY